MNRYVAINQFLQATHVPWTDVWAARRWQKFFGSNFPEAIVRQEIVGWERHVIVGSKWGSETRKLDLPCPSIGTSPKYVRLPLCKRLVDPSRGTCEPTPYGNWRGSTPCESERRSGDRPPLALRPSTKSRHERVSPTTPGTPVMGYFVIASQVVGVFLEIRYSEADCGVYERSYHRQKRRLARAVFADEQRQRRHADLLLVAEAAEVLESDLVHCRAFGLCILSYPMVALPRQRRPR